MKIGYLLFMLMYLTSCVKSEVKLIREKCIENVLRTSLQKIEYSKEDEVVLFSEYDNYSNIEEQFIEFSEKSVKYKDALKKLALSYKANSNPPINILRNIYPKVKIDKISNQVNYGTLIYLSPIVLLDSTGVCFYSITRKKNNEVVNYRNFIVYFCENNQGEWLVEEISLFSGQEEADMNFEGVSTITGYRNPPKCCE